MNIAILHSGDLRKISPGGISQYIEKVIKYSDTNSITVFGTKDKMSNYEIGKKYEIELEGKKYYFIPVSDNTKFPLSLYYFMNIFKYFKVLKEFDVIYAQRMEYALPFTFSVLKNKLVMAIHGSGRYSYLYWGRIIGTIYNVIERIAIRNCKKVVVLLKREEYGVPYYKNKFNDNSNKFVYGKVPIDTGIFKKIDKSKARAEVGLSKEDKVIIYFGRIDNNPKRILLLPEIIRGVKSKESNIKCIIIGNGEDKAKLEELIIDNGLSDQFILKQKLEHGYELIKYINASDISIILSNFEGICMSALESLACGVPVISTDVGDIKEYINENYNGYVIENGIDEKIINEMIVKINYYFEGKYIEINNKYEEYEATIVIKELMSLFDEVKS